MRPVWGLVPVPASLLCRCVCPACLLPSHWAALLGCALPRTAPPLVPSTATPPQLPRTNDRAAPAEFRDALAAGLGTDVLPRAFMAVRRSEWEHFGGMPLEEEAALLHARY